MDINNILTNIVAPIIIIGLPAIAIAYIVYDLFRKARRGRIIKQFNQARETKNANRLIELLKFDETLEGGAGKSLEELGDLAVEPLIGALQNSDQVVSNRAALLLGNIRDRRAVEHLLHLLRGSDESKISASYALGEIGDSNAIEPLFEAATQNINPDVRVAAGHALFQLGDSRANNVLMEALRLSPSLFFIANAIGTLAKTGDPKVIPLLISYLDHQHDDLRSLAAEGLTKIGEPAFDALIAVINSDENDKQRYACYALGAMGNTRALPALERLAQEAKNKEIREAAMYAINLIKKEGFAATHGLPNTEYVKLEINSIPQTEQLIQKPLHSSLISLGLGILATWPYLILVLIPGVSTGGSFFTELTKKAAIFSGLAFGVYALDEGIKNPQKTLLTYFGMLLGAGGMIVNIWFIISCQHC